MFRCIVLCLMFDLGYCYNSAVRPWIRGPFSDRVFGIVSGVRFRSAVRVSVHGPVFDPGFSFRSAVQFSVRGPVLLRVLVFDPRSSRRSGIGSRAGMWLMIPVPVCESGTAFDPGSVFNPRFCFRSAVLFSILFFLRSGIRFSTRGLDLDPFFVLFLGRGFWQEAGSRSGVWFSIRGPVSEPVFDPGARN